MIRGWDEVGAREGLIFSGETALGADVIILSPS